MIEPLGLTEARAVSPSANVPQSRIEPARAAQQIGEASLLTVVEALVERVGGVGELLQAGGPRRHRLGAPAQALDDIGPRRVVGAVARGAALVHPVGALFGEIADRGLDRRQVLLLLGRQS